MNKVIFIGIVMPLIMAALAVPLIFDLIPPNDYYGLRTPKSMSSPEVWYAANRASGIYLLLASVASLVISKLIKDRAAHLDAATLVFRMAMIFAACMLAALLASFLKLRSM
jgi:uncharacterized membrane protein